MVERFIIILKELKFNSAHFIGSLLGDLRDLIGWSRDSLSLGQRTEECSLKWISCLLSLGKSPHMLKCLKCFCRFMTLDQDAGCPAFLKYHLSLLWHFTKKTETKRTDLTSKMSEAELEKQSRPLDT